MASFTCLSCHVSFPESEGQRHHFRSDWHRYNLMRKVAQLPPVTRETYNDRVGQQQQDKGSEESKGKILCRPCKKTFANQNAYDNHVKSRRHVDMVVTSFEASKNKKNLQHQKKNTTARTAAAPPPPPSVASSTAASTQAEGDDDDDDDDDDDVEVEEVDSDEWDEDDEWIGEAVSTLDCLFCGHHSNTLEEGLQHMTEAHSFFVPDLDYCTNLPGLITYLGEKVGCGYECLWCGWRARRCPSVAAVRKHMQDKGHIRLAMQGAALLEYADFYDYSSSYPESGEAASADDEVSQTVLSGDGYQLVLPSGATVGHRSLARYYRQKMDPNRSASVSGGAGGSVGGSVVAKKQPGLAYHSVMAKYKDMGWAGATKADVQRKYRDLNFMTKLHKKQWMQISVKTNRLFQPRCQNPI